jgi:hypothetical protein
MLHFDEKGGKSREIPVRHDLAHIVFEYLDAADLRHSPADSPYSAAPIARKNYATGRRSLGFNSGFDGLHICALVFDCVGGF